MRKKFFWIMIGIVLLSCLSGYLIFKKDSEVKVEATTPKNYEQVYSYLQKNQLSSWLEDLFGGNVVYDMISTPDMGKSPQLIEESSEKNYSDTNVREEGVGEGDIVKTDGAYLYILKNKEIHIIDTTNEKMKSKAIIDLEVEGDILEFYLQDDKIVVVHSRDDFSKDDQTEAIVYDIKNLANIKALGKVSQSGSYKTSRLVGDYLYIFTDWKMGTRKKKDYDSYIPKVNDQLISADRILLPTTEGSDQYIVVASVNINKPNKVVDQKAMLSDDGVFYVSGKNMYLTKYINDKKEDFIQTSILKISYQDGKLKEETTGKVYGFLKDTFCIDEYDGYLRVVTTVDRTYNDKHWEPIDTSDRSNALYVLDEQLKVTGQIEGIAEDERIYSARFMGDMGYFVTFRDVDPLFSLDLSDPKAPKLVGELKIPGFSEYLHPYKDGLLFGIGMEVDERTGWEIGVKISMFDVHDPKNVDEIHKTLLPETHHSDAFYNYKSVMIDGEKNIIGFSANGNERKYYVFEYGEKGFVKRLEVEGFSLYGANKMRGVYIGENLYIVDEDAVASYNLNTYEKIERFSISS